MKKNKVKIGGLYVAKVSDKLVTVRIDSTHSSGGWNATNTRTGKRIRIKSAQRLRLPVASATQAGGPAKGAAKAKARGATKAAVAKDEKAKVAGGATTKKADREQKPRRVSALDAAAQVLKNAGKPMRARELIAAMAEQNLWTSPGGATPWATIYAAMSREERDKGTASRFRKVDRGQFEYHAPTNA